MPSSSKRVLCIGECMVELSPAGDGLYRQAFAGDSFNTATYLARQFSPGLEISYCTGLGTTGLSLAMLAQFESEGIKTDHVRRMEGENPGLYMIENDASGERYFQYWRGQSAAKKMFAGQTAAEIAEELSEFDALYMSGISLAILDDAQRTVLFDALALIRGKGETVIAFDPNYRPALWPAEAKAKEVYESIAGLCDIALVTLDDHEALYHDGQSAEEVASLWKNWGASEVVLKHGAANCLIEKDGERWQVAPSATLKPVDTTGAGDSFAAGYLGARLTGDAPDNAAALAHKVAGQVIMHPGGVISKEVWQTIERS